MSIDPEALDDRQAESQTLPEDHDPSTVFPAWPHFAEDEVEAAVAVLRSGRVNYWTGPEGKLFESEFAQHIGCRYAVAVANGTVALELALRGLDIGPGGEVVMPSRTFVGTASAVIGVGARPVFADVDIHSQCMTVETIRPLLSARTKCIIAVHLAGWPCDMEPIVDLCKAHGLYVVEDCAQAQGAIYKGRQVGSFGDAAAFSFCQDKMMTTAGEGGMVTTNDTNLWQRMWSYKDHGKSIRALTAGPSAGSFRWLHDSFGTNWRMTEVQAAIGRVQLRKMKPWLDIRRENSARLRAACSQLKALSVQKVDDSSDPAWYRFYAFVRPRLLREGWGRDRIAEAIRSEGVPCGTGSCSEVYLEKAFPPEWRPVDRLPVARQLGKTSLAFLVHPTLRERDLQKTCDVVTTVMKRATIDGSEVGSDLREPVTITAL